MHGGQQTGYHRISGISSHLLRAIGSNIKVLIISMLPSTAIYNPPRLSEKSRREQKRMYPTTGATTDFQSSEGALLLLRQSPPWSLLTENLSSHVICVLEAADVKTKAVRSQGLCKYERSFGHLPMMPLPQCQRLSDTTNDCRLRQSERSQSLQ